MEVAINSDAVYEPSEEVVFRDIANEVVIVPLTAGIGDVEDELFSLNETGRAIWEKLNGTRSVRDVALALAADFDAPVEELERDVSGFAQELLKRRMLVEVTGA